MQWFVIVGVESFRVPRQTEEKEESGPVTLALEKLKNYYDYTRTIASSYVETIKDLKLDKKAKWVNMHHDHTAFFFTAYNLISAIA